MTKIIEVFTNSDLRSGHNGLTKIAVLEKRNPKLLEPGNFLIFINRKRTAFKIFAANNIVAHYKSPDGRAIELQALQYVPNSFDSRGKLQFDSALKQFFETKIKRKGRL